MLASLPTRHKSGIDILAGPRQAAMKPEQRQSVTIEAISRLIEIANGLYDLLVVDIGVVIPADWAVVLQQAQTLLLVSEPTSLALGMIERHMAAGARAGVDCDGMHVVINRWWQSDEDGLAEFERNHKRAILARLPNEPRQLTEDSERVVTLFRGSRGSTGEAQAPSWALCAGAQRSCFRLHRRW